MPRSERPALGTRFEGAAASPGFQLWRVATEWQRRVREALEPHQLTHAQFVLLASAVWLSHEGDPTQSVLAAHAGTDPAMTSEVLATLERKHLLRRKAAAEDARARHVIVNAEGRRVAKAAVAAVEAVDVEYFGHPTPALTQLLALLTR